MQNCLRKPSAATNAVKYNDKSIPQSKRILPRDDGRTKKASWPTRQELRSYTLVVFVAITLLGIYVSLADFAIYNVVDLLTWLVKGGK